MRTAFGGRFCLNRSVFRTLGLPSTQYPCPRPLRWSGYLDASIPRRPTFQRNNNRWRSYRWRKCWNYYTRARTGTVLLAALSPAAFLALAEGSEDGTTTELEMLAASREEIEEERMGDAQGVMRVARGLYLLLDKYVLEVGATAIRFVHLVVIFVPVIVSVPVIWFGQRVKDRDNERTGTLWWYQFLVTAMERAGATFIKVGKIPVLQRLNLNSGTKSIADIVDIIARSMGSFAVRHISP